MKTFLVAALALMPCGLALAQGPVPPGGPGEHPGFPPDRGMHGPRPVSAAMLPLGTLSAYLGITDAQKGKIAQIREDIRGEMRPPVPGQAGPRNNRDNHGAVELKVAARIKTVLTPQQNAKLATLVKAAQALSYAHIRPEGLTKLQLTGSQLTRLAAATPQNAQGVLGATLTEAQNKVAKSYRMPVPPKGRGIAGELPPPPPNNI